MNESANNYILWALVVALFIVIYKLWADSSYSLENFTDSEEDEVVEAKLSRSEVNFLKKLAKELSTGHVRLPNIRVTGDMVVDGAIQCKRNLRAREINSIKVSSNMLDGAIVKGEIIKDNENLLVKRGQRIRITNGAGLYQVWNIEKDT